MLGLGLGVPMPTGVGATMDGPFSPLDLSPILWLDASDTSTITEVGGSVTQWDNKGSLGAFTQATAARQPTTGVTTLNGLNVLDFAADSLDSVDLPSAYNDLHNGTDHIIAAVVKFGTTADPDAQYMLLGNRGGSFTNYGMYFAYDDRVSSSRNDVLQHVVANGVTACVANTSGNDACTANTFGIVTVLADPNNATAANRSAISFNTNAAITNNTNTAATSSNDAVLTFAVGDFGVGGVPLTGSIAELVIVTGSEATEANRQALRNYMNAKWAVY